MYFYIFLILGIILFLLVATLALHLFLIEIKKTPTFAILADDSVQPKAKSIPWLFTNKGEQKIRSSFWFGLNKKVYHQFHNVYLRSEDGSLTEIDHLVLSRFGIFAVETKNLSGGIYGTKRDKLWTQKIGNQTHRFQNPLHQNYKHTRILEQLLGLRKDEAKSVIAFMGSAKVRYDLPVNVTFGDQCVRYIRSFHDEIYTKEQLATIRNKLEEVRYAPTREIRKEHIEALNNRFSNNQ